MEVKFKILDERAVIPSYAHVGDAAMDVTATSVHITDDYIEYGTGLAFQLPENHVMLIFPRSSNSKKDLLLCNSVGVLDSTYVGELKLRFKVTNQDKSRDNKIYSTGDRVGQIMILPYPTIQLKEVDELEETERGDGGFGSTGS